MSDRFLREDGTWAEPEGGEGEPIGALALPLDPTNPDGHPGVGSLSRKGKDPLRSLLISMSNQIDRVRSDLDGLMDHVDWAPEPT